MNYPIDQVIGAVLSILPDAEIGHDNEGQIIVYTGLILEADDVAGGSLISPLAPAPDGVLRLVVLNDGETFTDAAGVTVYDWSGENEIGTIEDALCAVGTDTEDPNLVEAGHFDNSGVII